MARLLRITYSALFTSSEVNHSDLGLKITLFLNSFRHDLKMRRLGKKILVALNYYISLFVILASL